MTSVPGLPDRYEIRTLTAEHQEWTTALLAHTNMFHSHVWPVVYPDGLIARLFELLPKLNYLVEHQIQSGLSIGVFDKEYEYKTAEGKAAGGALLWDKTNLDVDVQGKTLLDQMDFPLVSVALSYDNVNHLDVAKVGELVGIIPLFGTVYHVLGELDPRDPASWEGKKEGEVLSRNGTSTRHDYEGKGIMGAAARWLMADAAKKGFRGIQIECISDAVDHVWANAPAPFKSTTISEFSTETYKEEVDGKKVLPFAPSKQRITKVWVDLK
ncbi:hypothetical protein VHEMI09152 [[Torrubiella] hemipterigena]|uniref:N-acetyltransferase domain-containing protein n=1 Tax=[Torrubiella] hemipterigena TaxID=1531966 RepID=A0A0A1TFL6_9HYPO|nr:hypothetical protein VHEMI09152 [[Torrubiella] hemipterigena]